MRLETRDLPMLAAVQEFAAPLESTTILSTCLVATFRPTTAAKVAFTATTHQSGQGQPSCQSS